MKISVAKGKETLTGEIKGNVTTLVPNEVRHSEKSETELLKDALANPIGSKKLEELIVPGKKVVIITSDMTRPVPSYKILPVLLDELNSFGVKDSDVTVVFALGSHRAHTEEEKKNLVGEGVFSRVKCIDSDPENCVRLGVTKGGTNADIFKPVAEADHVICVGNIEYHYFAGYSGGIKAVMPGVSTPDAIAQNHGFMVSPLACTGNLKNNPVRDDLEEVRNFLKVDFIVNVVLDEHKKIVCAVAGDIEKAHREGCKFLDTLYSIKIKEKGDMVIVSSGGLPKDVNMYQAQKALDNAGHAVKKGGIIIWVASCKEGLGSAKFAKWMTSYTPAFMREEIGRNFELGGHKAAAIAMILENAKIFLVSDLDDELVKSVHLTPFASLQAAIDEAEKELGENIETIVMPYGGSTLPKV